MSTNPPDNSKPASRWTPEVVFGLVCLIASAIIPHFAEPAIGSTLAGLAAWFLGPLRSPLSPPRGLSRIGLLLVAVVVGLLATLFAGCASTSGSALDLRLRDHATKPAPACRYAFTVDGVVLVEGSVERCPVVPMCREVRP